jgi:hypothetical protein
MSEEPFEEFVRKAAKGYREPPPTPREEIWTKIQAARQQAAREQPQTEVISLAQRRARRWLPIVLAAAAILTLGVAIGRLTVDRPTPEVAVAPTSPDSTRPVATNLLRLAAVSTLSQVEMLLTDYDADQITDDFQSEARDLLSETRLLLGSRQLADPQLKRLLEDLELLLVQVARLSKAGQGDEREFIDEGIADRAIRERLRKAIPAGPAA